MIILIRKKIIFKYGIYREIKKFNPDIIHCVEQTPASTFCGAIAKTLNIPIVWSSHTNLDYYIPLYISKFFSPLSLRVYQMLRRTFLNISNYNMTVSNDFVAQLKQNGIKSNIHVWKTGVDSEAFNPKYRSQEMREKMFNGNYSSDKILLVSVGRLSPEKNFEFLIHLLNDLPQAFLCIVGGGPYKESLEPLFPKNQTHFMGFLQGTELAAAYASADYFVYASVSETFGQVYLEAMSSGVPIVAAEGKQMKEFHFVNGMHGYTWKPDDPNSACFALRNAIKNRDKLANNCRLNAINHSWNSAANQIEKVYIQLKNEKRNEHSLIGKTLNGIKYLSTWLYLNILILLFMVPFMNVAKPKHSATTTTTTTTTKSISKINLRQRSIQSNQYYKQNQKKLPLFVNHLINMLSFIFHLKRKQLSSIINFFTYFFNNQTDDFSLAIQFKKLSAIIISLISLTAIYAFFVM